MLAIRGAAVGMTFAIAGLVLADVRPSALSGEPGQLPPRDSAAPAASTGTARISGRVVAADSGGALPNTVIRIARGATEADQHYAWTNAEGRYEVGDLPAGRYTLRAEKTGYVTLEYGQRRPRESGLVVEMANGQAVGNVDFVMPKGAVIVARVLDEAGEPVRGIPVTVLEYRTSPQGDRRLLYTGGRVPSGRTDDRGMLRVFGLPPGEYYVRASPNTNGPAAMAPSRERRNYQETYHPETPFEAEAQAVYVGLGEERSVDVRLTVARDPMRIAGTVRAADGSIPSNTIVSVSGRQIPLQPDGTFEAADLPVAQEHSIVVRPERVDRPDAEYASARVDGRAGDQIVSIATSRPGTIQGRFVFDDGAAPPFRAEVLRFSAMSTGQITPILSEYTWNPDWSFEVTRLQGTFMFRLYPSAEWFLKAVRANGRDITDVPIEIGRGTEIGPLDVVVTRRATEVRGRVTDRANAALTDYVVVLFPENRALWGPQSRFVGQARPDVDGVFRIRGLPPGLYRAAAVTYLEEGHARSSALLERLLPGAAIVNLVEEQPTEITLTLSNY